MNQENEPQKIIVDVPTERGLKPLPLSPQQSGMEAFRRGWVNVIALPDTLPDLLFDLTCSLAIPALFCSAWGSLKLPGFIQFGGVVAVVIAVVVVWHLLGINEVRELLLIRLVLVAVGVMLGL